MFRRHPAGSSFARLRNSACLRCFIEDGDESVEAGEELHGLEVEQEVDDDRGHCEEQGPGKWVVP